MKLCGHCGQPWGLHYGYDHGCNRCLLVRDGFELCCLHGEAEAARIATEVRAWDAEREAAALVECYLGAYV